MLEPITLQGASVDLIPLSSAHREELCRIGLNPQLWRSTTVKIETLEQFEKYIDSALKSLADHAALPFVIALRSTGEVIGMTRFHSPVSEHKRVEIGMTWIIPEWQGTTVNTEIKFLMLKHAFERLGCVRVEFKANVVNQQSRRALVRIGATEEGVLRCYRVSPSGGTYDLVVFSVIADEWPLIRQTLSGRMKKNGLLRV